MSTTALLLVIGEGLVAVGAVLVAWYYASELERLRDEYAPPRHAVASPREPRPIFRRLLAARRRRAAVPAEYGTAGAATALPAVRFPCCAHCEDGSPCDPRDNHREPCAEGCNRAGALTPGASMPVLLANRNAEALGFPARITLTESEHINAVRELDKRAAGWRQQHDAPPPGENPYPPYVPAWQPIERKPTPDHAPWTGSQPALTSEIEAQMEAAELDRRLYLRSHLTEAEGMTDDDIKRAMRDAMTALRQPVYGQASVAGVLAAEDAGERLAGVTLP